MNLRKQCISLVAMLLGCTSVYADEYDLVVSSGRVIDPETSLNGIRNIGVNGGRIAAVSEAPLSGKLVIDAKGLIVAPGFIDLHAHGQDAGV